MNRYKSLFLSQSYQDCWQMYTDCLKDNYPVWDYVILTASNEAQAMNYRQQIDYRLNLGKLSKNTHYAVITDLNGQRIGSGGATLSVIKYIKDHRKALGHSYDEPLEGIRILCIHSGGDSKRIPQYSACGKLFSPVPRLLPDGRRSSLFDEYIIAMSGVAARISEGMLVCSGDVLLLFNTLQVDFFNENAAALSIKEHVHVGKNHGVYLSDGDKVNRFLHKQTEDRLNEIGAVDEYGNVDIDTGAVILDSTILERLYGLIDTDEKYEMMVNDRTRLSFYADFLYPLAKDSTLEEFYLESPEGDFTPELRDARTLIWSALHEFSMKLIRLSPAAFIHFGTTGELRSLVTDGVEAYKYLNWTKKVNTNVSSGDYAASNSYISSGAHIGQGSYIEDSYVHAGTTVGEGCILSGVTLNGQTIPSHTVLHGLKLNNGRFTVRMYGVEDNAKQPMLMKRELSVPLWEAPLFPVCDTIQAAVDEALQAYENGFVPGEGKCSLRDGFLMADTQAILDWQEKLDDKIKFESILEIIDGHGDLKKAEAVLGGKLSPGVERMLIEAAEAVDSQSIDGLGRNVRICRLLGRVSQEKEKYAAQCFSAIRNAVLQAYMPQDGAAPTICCDEVIEKMPLRVNWGGGWSDTPPYCLECGGTVLNAAITLNGEQPVEVVIRRIEGDKIILASGDSGISQEFFSLKDLQKNSDPFDPFALHKAVLVVCGVIPAAGSDDLKSVLDRLGGGFFLSTQVNNVPRGSGLGTSSILSAACVKAVMRFIGRELDDDSLIRYVLCVEQWMSTGGGWQDQVGGITAGIKLNSSKPSIRQDIDIKQLSLSDAALAELEERFCLIYTGQRRLARNLLREVIGRYIDGEPEAVHALYEIQRIAVLMAFELEKGNIDGFAKLMNRQWELSKELDANCTNTCIDQMFLAIEDFIDGKMICGAGGGGFLQVIMKKGIRKEQIRERLFSVFQNSGVDVWECSICPDHPHI